MCILLLFVVILSSLLIGYVERSQWLTQKPKPAIVHGDNGNIFYRDEPLERSNHSEAAQARLPSLVAALSRLRDTVGAGPSGDISEFAGASYPRMPEISSLFVHLIELDTRPSTVCMLGARHGVLSTVFLEALPDAHVRLVGCADDDATCAKMDKYLSSVYPSRFSLTRASSPLESLLKAILGADFDLEEAKEDWAAGDLDAQSSSSGPPASHPRFADEPAYSSSLRPTNASHGTPTRRPVPQHRACDFLAVSLPPAYVDGDTLPLLSLGANCPNGVYVSGGEAERRAWVGAVGARVLLQRECRGCYGERDSECSFCFGQFLCGADAAAAAEEREADLALGEKNSTSSSDDVAHSDDEEDEDEEDDERKEYWDEEKEKQEERESEDDEKKANEKNQ